MKTLRGLLSFLGIFLLFSGPVSAVPTSEQTGKVVFLDGDVTVNGQNIDIGDKIGPTCVIQTGKKSEVEIIFAEKNIFRIGAGSTVKVDFSDLQKKVFLEKGTFTSVLKKLAKAGGNAAFDLRTPTVNAGVRGTSFHVMTDGTSTYFCTCNGSVALDDGTGSNAVVLTNAHHGARIFTKGADGQISVQTAGLQGHTDADLESLAGKIQIPIDWNKPDIKKD